MPSSGRPKAQKNSTTVSGVLRNVVTQNAAEAAQRRDG